MNTAEEKKTAVRKIYTQVVNESSSCCGPSCGCGVPEVPGMSESYDNLEGYHKEADFHLGCGIPAEAAKLKNGDTVIDLGAGAGNDVFVIRRIVGEEGHVYGVDFTPAMLKKARENATKLGYANTEFVLGDIEDVPLKSEIADVIVSNCVMNLVPDKNKAYSEAYRLLKNGGHIAISDIVLGNTELPAAFLTDASLYAGCVSGAILKEDYLKIVEEVGFKNLSVVKQKSIVLPEDLFEKHGVESRNHAKAILSITIYAEK